MNRIFGNFGIISQEMIRFSSCLSLICFPLILIFTTSLSAAVVINEVCYDPASSDEGFEWIELYNNGTENEQLQGAQIFSGGQTFTLQYTLPAFVLRPGRYLLIGGTLVPKAQLTYNFSFQNGGSETDGIRYRSADASYTDTVLYDEPNTYGLSDDSGNTGTSFAPDAPAGCSLARIIDGYDTNASAWDFIYELFPTPGTANPVRSDYALGQAEISYESGIADLTVWLKNNSHFSPLLDATFRVSQQGELYSIEIAPIAANDSISVDATFACSAQNLSLELLLADDPNETNNMLVVSPVGGFTSGVMFSEFLADPDSGNQEWIELVSYNEIPMRGGVCIKDAAGNTTNFNWSGETGFYVLCRYKDQLMQRYPNCPPDRIIEASSWASLNNDGDSLILLSGGVVIDSLSYTGSEILKGVSRERYQDEDYELCWRNSFAAEGGTPGLPNSTAPNVPIPEIGKIQLTGSPCKAKAGEIITIAWHLPNPANRISCSIFDLRGSKVRTLADYATVNESGVLYWDGRKQNGSLAARGLYIILWESQSTTGGKVLQKQLTAVISD